MTDDHDSRRCPSQLVIERFLHGELPEGRQEAIKQHATRCTPCAELLQRVIATDKERQAAEPSAVFAAEVAKRVAQRAASAPAPRSSGVRARKPLGGPIVPAWAAGLVFAAVAALTVGLYSAFDAGRSDPMANLEGLAEGPVTLKGAVGHQRPGAPSGSSLRIYRRHQTEIDLLSAGEAVAVGDVIRFEIDPAAARFLLILSLSAEGSSQVYAPFDGERSRPVQPHQTLRLPAGITIDHETDELLIALLSEEPLTAQAAMLAARRAFDAARQRLQDIGDLSLPGSETVSIKQHRFVIRKVRH